MPEQQLDGAQVRAVLEQVARKCVSERVRRDRFGEPAAFGSQFAGIPDAIPRDVRTRDHARKHPRGGSCRAVPITQDHQELIGEHDVAILLSLALYHTDSHALTVDVGGPERDRFRDAQSRRVANGEDRARLATGHAAQELPYLFGTQDDWQCLGRLWHRQDFLHVPGSLQRHGVQEAQRRGRDADRARCELLLVCQIDLVGSDVDRTEPFRRSPEVAGKERDLPEVRVLGVPGKVADLHVFEHALS